MPVVSPRTISRAPSETRVWTSAATSRGGTAPLSEQPKAVATLATSPRPCSSSRGAIAMIASSVSATLRFEISPAVRLASGDDDTHFIDGGTCADQGKQPVQAALVGHQHLVAHIWPAAQLREQHVGIGQLGNPPGTRHGRDADVLEARIKEPLDEL